MKVRHNKRRILTNLRFNNLPRWLIWKYVVKAHKLKERNEKIKKILDEH